MQYQFLLFSKDAGIGMVTINRPESLNALSAEVFAELYALFSEIENDPGVHVVIISGSGEKAFVAGADIADMRHRNAQQSNAWPAAVCTGLKGRGYYIGRYRRKNTQFTFPEESA